MLSIKPVYIIALVAVIIFVVALKLANPNVTTQPYNKHINRMLVN